MQGLQSAAYTYDGDGKLVKAVEDGVTTLYVGAHYQVSGGVATKYYFAGTQRIAQRKSGALFFILADHLGSTSLVTDAAGTVIADTRYTPYGETRFASGTSPTDYLYTSQRQEAGLGLYFYNARWYDRLWDGSPRQIQSFPARVVRFRTIVMPIRFIIQYALLIQVDIGQIGSTQL